jgi:Ca2+-binding EF-hand superfamily protein
MQTKLVIIATGVFILLVAVATASPAAVAQKDGTPNVDTPKIQAALVDEHVMEILIVMNHDRNGTVSQEEFIAFMRAEFNKLERDQSGQVNAKELAASKPSVVPSARYGK